MSDKPQIYSVAVQIKAPANGSTGRVAEGRYTFIDGTVTLTDRLGNGVRDDNGKTYSRKLTENDSPRTIAGRLTKEFRLALLGKDKPQTGFASPINYPNLGIC